MEGGAGGLSSKHLSSVHKWCLCLWGGDLGLSGLGTCTHLSSQPMVVRQCTKVGGLLRDMGRKQILVTGFRSQTAGCKGTSQ